MKANSVIGFLICDLPYLTYSMMWSYYLLMLLIEDFTDVKLLLSVYYIRSGILFGRFFQSLT